MSTFSSMSSDQTQARLSELRARQQSGEKLSIETMREVLTLIRGDRIRASAVSAKSKASKAPIDSNALLDEI